MTISKRLLISFGAMAAIVAGLGGTGLYSIRRLAAELRDYSDATVPKCLQFGSFKADITEARLAGRNGMYYASLHRDADFAMSRQKFHESMDRAAVALDQIRPLLVSEKGKLLVAALSNGIAGYRSEAEKQFELLQAGKDEEARQFAADKLVPAGERIIRNVDGFLQLQNEHISASAQHSASASSSAIWTTLVLLLVGGSITVLVFFSVRRLERELREMATDLREGSHQISSAAQEVANSGQTLAQHASEQAASTEEISAVITEVSAATRQNGEAAVNSTTLMNDAQSIGEKVQQAMQGMGKSVEEINSATDAISKTLRVIDEIAFQTNILALNAAVEAARAGESGAGFAVVADEVRSLAHRSAQAAQDTTTLIERSLHAAREGKTRLADVTSTWSRSAEIRASSKGLAESIARSATEQTSRLKELESAVNQLSAVTQSVASQSEENAAAGQELSSQSETLKALAGRLQVMVGGDGE